MNTTTTTATEMITGTIVNMYREGQIEKGEELTKWAWSNRLPVSVDAFARTWQAVTSTTETDEAEEVETEEVKAEDMSEEQKARIKKALSTAVETFMDSLARERFGQHLTQYRAFAEVLEQMSEDARAKRFDKLVRKGASIHDVWGLYKRTYNTIGKYWMSRFAPNAMAPNEFMVACSYEEVFGQMDRITCPCCGGAKFEDNDAMPPLIGPWGMRASFWCMSCGFPLHVTIKFEA